MTAITKPKITKDLISTFVSGSVRIILMLRRFVLALQLARMISALNNQPDWVLEEIGITRAAIPEYARKLIYEL